MLQKSMKIFISLGCFQVYITNVMSKTKLNRNKVISKVENILIWWQYELLYYKNVVFLIIKKRISKR